MTATSKGFEIHRFIYINLKDGVEYHYLTNEFSLPAWSIILLYKHSWDIEKVFDELVVKCGEQRSWASPSTAQQNKPTHTSCASLTT